MLTAIIMASGFSRRMGENKLLMNFMGKALIEHVIEAAKNSDLDKIVLIYRDEKILQIGKKHGIQCFFNDKAHLGQSQSVILGIRNAPDGSYMFLVGDQPFISTSLINKLIMEHKKDKSKIILPTNGRRIGMPIIFPNKFKEDLLKVNGDKGGRDLIRENINSLIKVLVENKKELIDIDDLEDYNYWVENRGLK